MMGGRYTWRVFVVVSVLVVASVAAQPVQGAPQSFEPVRGQGGKDVVWVPTPQVTVDKMLELAQVTASDGGSGNPNRIALASLSTIDRLVLKEAFRGGRTLQQRLACYSGG